MVDTPVFDRVAREGVLFSRAYCASPGCSPSRASLLTGLHTWQLAHAGTHASWFDPKYETFPDRLAGAGYFCGYTGKGWGPGDYAHLGRKLNPAGPKYAPKKSDGVVDYQSGFAEFLANRPKDRPFCFWFGSYDPHRDYVARTGVSQGKALADAEVPPFLPDAPEVRSDLLDYACEVERFDRDIGKMLKLLEQSGELDNTLVIVTSDNGMPFPRAKANCYEYGIHMPLAILWGGIANPGRTIDDLVGFVDLTATIYEIAGADPPRNHPLVGKSLVPLFRGANSGVLDDSRTAVFAARERHSSSRYNSLGYPQRAIRTRQHLYIRNFTPERWPAGPLNRYENPVYPERGEPIGVAATEVPKGLNDIDGSPTKDYLRAHQSDQSIKPYFELAVAKRPAEELFDVEHDPGCLNNLAGNPEFAQIQLEMSERLMSYLRATDDPRVTGNGDVWETYPRVSRLRWFSKPAWARLNPESVPSQPWLESRHPRSK